MSVLQLIASNSFLTVNKNIARALGIDAAIVFADLASAQQYYEGEWFYRTRETIEEETTLSAKVQAKAVSVLVASGILKTKIAGLPAKTYYFIGEQEVQNLLSLLRQKGATRNDKKEQQEPTKRRDINNNKEIIIKNDNKEIIKEQSSDKLIKIQDVVFFDSLDAHTATKEKISGKKEKYPAGFPPELIPHVDDFIQYRKEIKKPYRSDKSLTVKINQLFEQYKTFGLEAVIDSIQTAIAQGYQGTFIDKKYQKQAKPAKVVLTASEQDLRDELAMLKTKAHNKRIDFSHITGTISEQITQLKKLLNQ